MPRYREKSVEAFSSESLVLVDKNKSVLEKIEQVPELTNKWINIIKQFGIEKKNEGDFVQQNQDVIEQLIIGLRIVQYHETSEVKSFVLSTKNNNGAVFIVSVVAASVKESVVDTIVEKEDIESFYKNQSQRQGVAVLSFDLSENDVEFSSNINSVFQKYKSKHPNLLATPEVKEFSSGKTSKYLIFEAFAYYSKENVTEPDKGTKLRFIERTSDLNRRNSVLPGFTKVDHSFDGTSMELIFDHWVSNVVNREQFLQTLEDVLGFTPKVDFNAGVVAAGKAKIESTVTGNTLKAEVNDSANNLQVYLPINNALSSYGHVHLYLQEIGQGVQHVASRVDNLINLMDRVNCFRKITGRGFNSLNIPRVYYGVLDKEKHINSVLMKYMGKAAIDSVSKLFDALVAHEICTITGVVSLDLKEEVLLKVLAEFDFDCNKENKTKLISELVSKVKLARYCNIYNLAEDTFSQDEYLSIVRNQILLDKQGQDFLLQIFTSNILQENAGEEAPFLEFIQRKCSTVKVVEKDGKKVKAYQKPKPGCGGFGIRNFLTLFLSIEVSKAMQELQALIDGKDVEQKSDVDKKILFAKQKIELFTQQLEESNPILNKLSEVMTEEAMVLQQIQAESNDETKQDLENRAVSLKNEKETANIKLQNLSETFVKRFESIEVASKYS